MALHFILDGYNIIKQIPPLANMKLDEGRETLIRFIETKNPQGSYRNQVTVVFDGQGGSGGYQQGAAVKVLFSWDESADDQIKRLVDNQENRKSLVVVTDDREIQYYVRALGAQVLSVADFWEKIKSPEMKSRRPKSKTLHVEDKKDIPKTLEAKINAEFEKIWSKKSK